MNKQLQLQKFSLVFTLFLFFFLTTNAQDAITWTLRSNGSKVADTVTLEDYLPVRGGIVYQEVVIDLPIVTKEELFSRAN